MKNIGSLAIALILACGSMYSQTQQGSWELSLSGNFGSVSGTSETTSSSGTFRSEQKPQGYASLAFRPGFYIIDGLAVEPEILWTALEGDPPAFAFTGNVAFNFTMPGSHVTPFVLAGYGLSNAVPYFQRLLFRSTRDLDIILLNAGAGLKIFLADRIALRIDYRYQNYSRSSTSGSGPFTSTTKTTSNFHNFFVGFSIFLP